ncbi:MAG: transposase [Bacteroidetes bacterium]|jgi:rfaE bifunctional protein kinase chain/domain|nr:transposase [Bacteroidota bacterium]
MGDVLIVTITPDRFVNKGPSRPTFTSALRAEAIAALEMVDFVLVNSYPTAIEIINILKPDFYVKGPDYKNADDDLTGNIILEKEAVKANGGEIAFTNDDTFSSSNLINEHISPLKDEQKIFIEKLKSKYSIDKIKSYLDKLSSLKVLLVGEVIVDEYIFCDTIGKSGKEPILVTQRLFSEKYAGGILAVANHISDFCKQGNIVSYIGDRDDHVEFINSALDPAIQTSFISKKNSPTILKTRFIDNYSKTKTLGVYDINDELLSKNEESKILNILELEIQNYDAVIVTDYGHGLITPDIVQFLEKRAKFLAVNTQINASNIGYHTISKYSYADCICIHEGELRHDYRNRTDSVEVLTKKLHEKLKSDITIITRGNTGSLVHRDEKFINCPAYAGKIVDRVGAGDSLLAISSLCFAAGLPTDISIFLGNLAAAEKIATIGNKNKVTKVNLIRSIEALLK